jgi:uncharacterized coiled-coil DUF342 family protein
MDNIASLLEELERQVDMVEKDQMEIRKEQEEIKEDLRVISDEQSEIRKDFSMISEEHTQIKEDFSMISLKLDEISEEQERIRECIKIESKACEEDALFFKNLRSEVDEIAADLKDLKKQVLTSN